MADAQASGACSRKAVWVQVPSPACKKNLFGRSLQLREVSGGTGFFVLNGRPFRLKMLLAPGAVRRAEGGRYGTEYGTPGGFFGVAG